jgi:hypothetical protein
MSILGWSIAQRSFNLSDPDVNATLGPAIWMGLAAWILVIMYVETSRSVEPVTSLTPFFFLFFLLTACKRSVGQPMSGKVRVTGTTTTVRLPERSPGLVFRPTCPSHAFPPSRFCYYVPLRFRSTAIFSSFAVRISFLKVPMHFMIYTTTFLSYRPSLTNHYHASELESDMC